MDQQKMASEPKAVPLGVALSVGLISAASAGCGPEATERAVIPAVPTVVVAAPAPAPAPAGSWPVPEEEVLRRLSRRQLGRWLSGRWDFSHGGEPWFEAEIEVIDGKISTGLKFNRDISWVTFEITDIRTKKGPWGTVIVMHGVAGDDSTAGTRDITLRVKSHKLLVGEVYGDHYDKAVEVKAVRRRK